MADNQLTVKQLSEELEKALKPVHVGLEKIEKTQNKQSKILGEHGDKIDSLIGEMLQIHQQVDVLDDKMESQQELLHEVKIDLDVIKEDYIGQVEEIRSNVGMSPILKHKTA